MLDFFFRAQSAVCGSCCLPAYSCQTLCKPTDGSPPAPLPMGYFRQEHWSGWPFPSLKSCPLTHPGMITHIFLLFMRILASLGH